MLRSGIFLVATNKPQMEIACQGNVSMITKFSLQGVTVIQTVHTSAWKLL